MDGKAPASRRARPTACRLGGPARPPSPRRPDRPVAAIMSTRMRSVVVSVTPLPSRSAEIAAEQGGAVEGQHRADQRQPRRARRSSHRRAASAAAARASSPRSRPAPAAPAASALRAQEIREAEEDRATIGSSLALKSRSTEANCGSTKVRKNNSTRPPRTARRRDSAARRRAVRRSASARLRSAASTSRIWSSAPEASPTRTSATYIGGNSFGCRAMRLAEAFARQHAARDTRRRPAAGGRHRCRRRAARARR